MKDKSRSSNNKSSLRSRAGLDWLNFFLADEQTSVGPFLAIYLAGHHWDEQQVGLALTLGGIAGIAMQTPAGWLVDRLRCKRAIVAAGVIALAIGALVIAFFPAFWPTIMGEILVGGASSVFTPAICAISLGLVGRQLFDSRQGRNQTFNSGGNVVAAILMGFIGYFISNRGVFLFTAFIAAPTLFSVFLIQPNEIDYELARGAEKADGHPIQIWKLLQDRPLIVFLVCAVMFHFANAAMLPLLGEMLAKGKGRSSMMFMSACVITTQLVITLLAWWVGKSAAKWGRKPLLLIAFMVLPIRGFLYIFTGNTILLVAIQILDGIGAGIFGVVSVLVVADLTRGTGRFNFTLGVISAAVGIGASLSQVIAGGIVHRFGYSTGFIFLALVALAALTILYFFMPETSDASKNRASAI